MKRIFLTACTLLIITAAFSQTQRGNVLVGAELANIGFNFQEENTQFSFNLSPKAAWFLRDNVAIGPEVLLGLNTQKGATSVDYGVGIFGRKYLGAGATNLARTTKWLLEANAGIYGTNLSGDEVEKTSTNGLGLGFGPGIAYFLNPNISLEALAKYNLTVGFGSSTTNHKLGINLGFQIYLPGRQVRQLTKDPVK
ncbi:MAG TPA: outer membrane beta-barrel protein [Panacibacter sp.]|nr:outer membrane beta-barrel protein [Panacibacter sp.]HNP43171.1 outer membrane beta-barrel protein [Panacibacter sp.]